MKVGTFWVNPLNITSYIFQESTENCLTIFVASLWEGKVLLLHIITHDILGQCLQGELKHCCTRLSSFSKIMFQNSFFLILLYWKDLVSSARAHQANGRNCFLQRFVHKIHCSLLFAFWSFNSVDFVYVLMEYTSYSIYKKWLIFRLLPFTVECLSEIPKLK